MPNIDKARERIANAKEGKKRDLSLSGLKLTELPIELYDLPDTITSIHLKGNNLSQLPFELTKFKNLKHLCLSGNPLNNLPKDIRNQNPKAILNYLESIQEQEADYLYEAKLILVGRGAVGKTTLLKKLTDSKFCITKEETESTEGIDIQPWDIPAELPHSNSFRFDIWDFAGQKKYDATHQFFLTEDSLYLFVTTAREGMSFHDYEYWLNVIKVLSKESPVLVIQNKIDERSDSLPTIEFQERFPNIKGFHRISCAPGFESSIIDLETNIRYGLESMDWLNQIGDALPKSWVSIRKDLENLTEDYIPYSQYLEICSVHGLEKHKAQYLINYFHNLGIVVYKSDDLLLKRIIITNPDWAVDGAYAVLDHQPIIDNNGKFNDSHLDEVWKESRYENSKAELLSLMLSFGLCFELNESSEYIAPQLLSSDPVEYIEIDNSDSIKFEYQYEFMPAGIISRLIVKIHPFIEQESYWRFGVILNYGDSRAEIIEDYLSRKITIHIDGTNKKELLTIVRMQINEINESFKGINFEEKIYCNCPKCLINETNHFHDYEVLRRFERKGINTIPCSASTEMMNIPQLLNDSVPFDRSTLDKSYGINIKVDNRTIIKKNKFEAEDISITENKYDELIQLNDSDKYILAIVDDLGDDDQKEELREAIEQIKLADSHKTKQKQLSKVQSFILSNSSNLSKEDIAKSFVELSKYIL